MLYVLILYCTGWCPPEMNPPNGVLFYATQEACEAHRALMWTPDRDSKVLYQSKDGKIHELKRTRFLSTCANMYADPEELDRLLNPAKLSKLLQEYDKKHPAWHPPQVLPPSSISFGYKFDKPTISGTPPPGFLKPKSGENPTYTFQGSGDQPSSEIDIK